MVINMKTVDVIIPTYKPTGKLKKIISMLERQTYPVSHIILVNTEEKYFNTFFYGSTFLEQYHNLIIRHISKYEFDHGGTRRMAVGLSHADYFIFMTDDAVPEDKYLIQNLLKPLLEGEASVSYGRQLAGRHCSEMEYFTRKFNYPKTSQIKTKKDLEKMGIKAFFCSNVCAAYDRHIYDKLGGFVKHTIFNEDMIFAYHVLMADQAIAYAADARVVHYHRYSNLQQLKRNFDLGVSQADHPEIFGQVSSSAEGKKLVLETAKFLRENKKGGQIPGLYLTSFYKYLGYRLGKIYKKLPRALIRKLTMNENYWKKEA